MTGWDSTERIESIEAVICQEGVKDCGFDARVLEICDEGSDLLKKGRVGVGGPVKHSIVCRQSTMKKMIVTVKRDFRETQKGDAVDDALLVNMQTVIINTEKRSLTMDAEKDIDNR
ncbi:hypothetical protein VTL71DRAFT_4958 [Oculimacula yallundae]|uniref:Uncharacterized protein n=1 Tax=Oculimacula yallundae TaxID=86028 RepID=A0ABR4C3H6_9HELO